MSGSDLSTLKDELRGIIEDIQRLQVDLGEEQQPDAKTNIQEKITHAEKSKEELRSKILETIEADCLSEKSVTIPAPAPVDIKSTTEPSQSTPSSSSSTVSLRNRDSVAPTSSNLRIKQPKEYKNGEDFSTFGYRFKIFVETNKTDRTDYSNALLSCVDDITLQKLMPVIDNLTDRERQDIRVLLDRCREALYPKSEMRALRQQLTSAKIVQSGEEEVEEFAARIRSLANRAGYKTESEKSEACLNAFLNGLNAELADKLYAAPDVENDFEIAVSTARKLEKMRRVRASPVIPDHDNLASVFRVAQARGSRVQQHHRQSERSNEQQQLLTHVGNYSQQGNNAVPESRPADTIQQDHTERRVRTESRTCYRCGVKGHIARFCRAPTPLNM